MSGTLAPTPAQRTRLLALAASLRKICAPVGPQHAWFDLILDMEAIADGKPPTVTGPSYTATWFISMAEHLLEEYGKK